MSQMATKTQTTLFLNNLSINTTICPLTLDQYRETFINQSINKISLPGKYHKDQKKERDIQKNIFDIRWKFRDFGQDLIAMVYLAGFCTLQHRLPR